MAEKWCNFSISVLTTSKEQTEVDRNHLIFYQQLLGIRRGRKRTHFSLETHPCFIKLHQFRICFLGSFFFLVFFSSDSEQNQNVKMSCKWGVLGLTSSVVQICEWSCVAACSNYLLAREYMKMGFSSPTFLTQRNREGFCGDHWKHCLSRTTAIVPQCQWEYYFSV